MVREGSVGPGRKVETSAGEVAWDVRGEGSPVVLVHGTPSNSYLWRDVVERLAKRHSVYTYDLPGFGASEKREGQDVSIAAQARVLGELAECWELVGPMVAGHDIGGGTVLRAHLVEGVEFSRIALLDAVVMTPWGTQTLKHVQANADVYRTMPEGPFEAIVASHLRTATVRPLDESSREAYLSQWRGVRGREAYLRKDVQLDERDTAELHSRLADIEVPVRIVWGAEDVWLDPSHADILSGLIPGSTTTLVPGAGHFVMEDAQEEVSGILSDFFSDEAGRAGRQPQGLRDKK